MNLTLSAEALLELARSRIPKPCCGGCAEKAPHPQQSEIEQLHTQIANLRIAMDEDAAMYRAAREAVLMRVAEYAYDLGRANETLVDTDIQRFVRTITNQTP